MSKSMYYPVASLEHVWDVSVPWLHISPVSGVKPSTEAVAVKLPADPCTMGLPAASG